MIAGIDVGGTYTDAVLLAPTIGGAARVLACAKRPTRRDDLSTGIVSAFDSLFEGSGLRREQVGRVTVSTTLATNAVVSGNLAPVAALVIPGPGVSPRDLRSMVGADGAGLDIVEIGGYVDHRGREVEPLDPGEVRRAVEDLRSRGFARFAVAGKFSTRNACQEQAVAEAISCAGSTRDGPRNVTMGHTLSGSLNLPRRVSTAALNSAVIELYDEFVAALTSAFRERGVVCPVYILKADGGTMEAATSGASAVKTILSGPAASIIGSMALSPEAWKGPGVTVDIGGTTTDVSFFVNGSPLFEPRGAEIGGRKTLVRALYSRSIGIGGDSPVRAASGRPRVGVKGHTPAAAFGGEGPSLTDALVVCGMTHAGDGPRAAAALAREARRAGVEPEEWARQAVDNAVATVSGFIRTLLEDLNCAPAYTVREVITGRAIEPACIVGIGAPAPALVPLIGRELGVRAVVPELAPVGNAVGAALAVPTREATLRIDTAEGTVTVAEDGVRERLRTTYLGEAEAAAMAREYALRRAGVRPASSEGGDVDGRADDGRAGGSPAEAEVVEMQWFNVVRDFHTVGRIFDVKAQVRPSALRLDAGAERGG